MGPPSSGGLRGFDPPGQQSTAVRAQEWWLPGLHVTQAWRASEGAGITVAVLGTGVAAGDPDLDGAVVAGPDYTDSASLGRVPGSPYWGVNGTAVAGIIAGHGFDGNWKNGIVGVAPAAKILAVRVTLEFNDPLASDQAISQRLPDAIADGVRYAVDHGARVIDLPLDPGTLGLTDTGDPAAAGGSPAERAAVAYALDRGVVLVAPAGDDGDGSDLVNYPAAYQGVIAVGATDRAGQLAPFSSTRSHAALTAPGVDLVDATPPAGYGQISSTSTASGIVAGVAALILARFPRLTVAQVRQALIESTAITATGAGLPPLPAHPPAGTGYGTVDAARALQMAALISAASQPRPPAVRPVRPHKPAPGPATAPRQPDTGALAGSVLRGAVAGVSLLILLLVVGLLAVRFRRERGRGAAARPAGWARGHGQHEHRRPDRAPIARAASAASAASAGAAASADSARSGARHYGAAGPGPPAGTPARLAADGWPSPAGWQGGGIGEIGYGSPAPARPALAPVPRSATGSRTGRPAGSQAGPAGPPWAPAPEPEPAIGPLPVASAGFPPPQLGSGIRVPGDMAARLSTAADPPASSVFGLSAPPADLDVSAPAFRLMPPAFGVTAPPGPVHSAPTDPGLPAPSGPDLPAPTDPDLRAPTIPDLPAAAGPGLPAAAGPDLSAAAGPDLPTRQSLGFAAAPVPADYLAPPAAAPSPDPSSIWELAATDVFPPAAGPGPAPDKTKLPPAPESDSGPEGS